MGGIAHGSITRPAVLWAAGGVSRVDGMIRRLAAITTVFAATALAAPLVASANIVVNSGMAGVRLQMTQQQVRDRLGPPLGVTNGTNDFGAFREFRYRGEVTVSFQGLSRVTAIVTTGVGPRTASGVGAGSTESFLRANLSGETCKTESGFRHCFIGAFLPGRRVTDFAIRSGRVFRVTVGFVID